MMTVLKNSSQLSESKVGNTFGGVSAHHSAHHGLADVHQTFVDRRTLRSHRVSPHGVPVLPHCELLLAFSVLSSSGSKPLRLWIESFSTRACSNVTLVFGEGGLKEL